jgi:uncharacterized protein YigE (DUF2233 family)
MFKLVSRKFLFFILLNWIVGCNPIQQTTIAPTATLIPTSIPSLSVTLTPIALDTGWHLIQPGLEHRLINLYEGQDQWDESLYMVRLNLNQFRLDVAYHEIPQSLEDWQTETKALIVVNGGYFRKEDDKYIPNGLTIVNGEIFGSSYDAYAGMLAISDHGTELRWLANQPYNPNESLLAALQSFPMLVKPGGELGFTEQYEDSLKARRTVIAQDQDGRILFIVASRGYFTLHQLSVYLTESDLHLDIAVNLDGGPSSGILIAKPQEIIPAQGLLPVVILAYVR